MFRVRLRDLSVSAAGSPPAEEDDFWGVCTLIGCESGVDVRLVQAPDNAATARICADDRCKRKRPALDPGARFPCSAEPRRLRIAVTVRDVTGDLLMRRHKRVRLRKYQPNGPNCPPTCYVAVLKFDVRAGEFERVSAG